MLYILRLNENFNFDANKAKAIITLFKEYLNKLKLSLINIAYPAIIIAKIGVLLLAKYNYNNINTRDLAYLFLTRFIHLLKNIKEKEIRLVPFILNNYNILYSLV